MTTAIAARLAACFLISGTSALVASTALADPLGVTYLLEIRIDRVSAPQEPTTPCVGTGCPSPGLYTGSFTLDEAVFAQQGLTTTTPLAFYFALGEFVWDSEHDSDFVGFRGFGFGNWMVNIAHGELTQLCRGVFSGGDASFVDLHGGPPIGAGNRVLVRGSAHRSAL